MFKALCFVMISFVSFALTPIARGDYHVAPVQYQEGGWNFSAIYSDSASSATVVAFLAYANPEIVTGDNIQAVLFQRDFTTATWHTTAWETATPAEAIKYVKGALNIPDKDDVLWGLDDTNDIVYATGGSAPVDYVKGLLANDPFAAAIENDS